MALPHTAPGLILRARPAAAVVALLFLAALCPSAAAQEGELDAVAREIAARLAREKIRSVVVGDILGPGESRTELGEFLAGQLTEALRPHAARTSVLPREKWEDTCTQFDLSVARMLHPGTARWLAERAGAEAIVVGRVERSDERYFLELEVHYAREPKKNHRVEARLARTAEFDQRASARLPRHNLPSEADQFAEVFRPGQGAVGYPRCRECRDPRFTEAARRAKHESFVQLRVIITAEGRAARIRVMEGDGFGLTEQAIAAVSKWRFYPATDAAGNPVATETTIEIYFLLIR